MTYSTCPECGNPRVFLVWDQDLGGTWTGGCRYCGSILFLDKGEVVFI